MDLWSSSFSTTLSLCCCCQSYFGGSQNGGSFAIFQNVEIDWGGLSKRLKSFEFKWQRFCSWCHMATAYPCLQTFVDLKNMQLHFSAFRNLVFILQCFVHRIVLRRLLFQIALFEWSATGRQDDGREKWSNACWWPMPSLLHCEWPGNYSKGFLFE